MADYNGNDGIENSLEDANSEVDEALDYVGEKAAKGAKAAARKGLKAVGKALQKAVKLAGRAVWEGLKGLGNLIIATMPISLIVIGAIALLIIMIFFIYDKYGNIIRLKEAITAKTQWAVETIQTGLEDSWDGITNRPQYEDEIDAWNGTSGSPVDPDMTALVYQTLVSHEGVGDHETSDSPDDIGTTLQDNWMTLMNKENPYFTQDDMISILLKCMDHNNKMFRFFHQYYEYKQWKLVAVHKPGTTVVDHYKWVESFPTTNTRDDGLFEKQSRIHIEGEELDGERRFAVHWQDVLAAALMLSQNKMPEDRDWDGDFEYDPANLQTKEVDPEAWLSDREIEKVFDLFKYEFNYLYGTDDELNLHDAPPTVFKFRRLFGTGPELEKGEYTLGYRYKRLPDPDDSEDVSDPQDYPGELPYTKFVPEQAPNTISNSFETFKYIYMKTEDVPDYTPDPDVYEPPSGGYCVGRWHIINPKDFIDAMDSMCPYYRDLSEGGSGTVRQKYGYNWVADLIDEYGEYLDELPFTDDMSHVEARSTFYRRLGEQYSHKLIILTYEGTNYGDAEMAAFVRDYAALYPGWTVKWNHSESNMTDSFYPPFENPDAYPFWSYAVTFRHSDSYDVEEKNKLTPEEIQNRDYQDAEVPIHNFNGDEAAFLEEIKQWVIEDMKETGILASLTAAQACLESRYGTSGLTKKANNLFGIKGEYNGQYVTMRTREEDSQGNDYYVYAKFRAYDSWKESISDHSRLFVNNQSRYGNLIGETDWKEATRKVKEDGYATDSRYTASLRSIIEAYKLYEWDTM